MSPEPENLVLRALRDIRADAAETKAELKSEIRSLAAAVTSDILTINAKIDATRNELSDQIVGLRRAVVEYHSVVIGSASSRRAFAGSNSISILPPGTLTDPPAASSDPEGVRMREKL
jgi:hypothetical protein